MYMVLFMLPLLWPPQMAKCPPRSIALPCPCSGPEGGSCPTTLPRSILYSVSAEGAVCRSRKPWESSCSRAVAFTRSPPYRTTHSCAASLSAVKPRSAETFSPTRALSAVTAPAAFHLMMCTCMKEASPCPGPLPEMSNTRGSLADGMVTARCPDKAGRGFVLGTETHCAAAPWRSTRPTSCCSADTWSASTSSRSSSLDSAVA